MHPRYRAGDPVIYQMAKYSSHPTPRAKEVYPTGMGEGYHYVVEKYWMVVEVLEDGQLKLVTRGGKTHVVDPGSPLLRRASWWQRTFHRDRFPQLVDASGEA